MLMIMLCACDTKQSLSNSERYAQMRATLSSIPSGYPMQKTTDGTYYLNLSVPPYVDHSSVLTSFMEKTKKGISAQLVVVAYTDEGDPILTIVQYTGSEYLAIRDDTRDKYGVGGIEEFAYSHWVMFTNGERKMYYLFNQEITWEAFMKSRLSSNSSDQIDALSVCFE
jgi:hypothetical protein